MRAVDGVPDLNPALVFAHRPGKPTIVALIDSKPAFGLPGNPVSAIVVFGILVRQAIYALAGCHLLDEETGEYNVKYAKRYVRGKSVVLVNFVRQSRALSSRRVIRTLSSRLMTPFGPELSS